MEVFGTVYLIVNLINGKMYVGQTIQTLSVRFNKHCYADSLLGRAIRKYGKENFRYGVLKTCTSKLEMDEWEKFFISFIRCKAPNGYNLTDGGGGTFGYIHKPETCAKISAALIGEKHPNYGKHPTDETRAKRSAAMSGEKNPFFGKHHTSETCIKIAESLKGRFCGKDNPFFGKQHAKEFCAKSSAEQRGYSPFKNLLNEIYKHQFTYAALAKLMGLSRKAVSAKMCGKLKFTVKDKIKLVEIFGKTVEYLMQRE